MGRTADVKSNKSGKPGVVLGSETNKDQK